MLVKQIRHPGKLLSCLLTALVLIAGLFVVIGGRNNRNTSTVPNAPKAPLSSQTSDQFGLPDYNHIVIIVMENKAYQDIINNPKAPYINNLSQTYSLAANYSAASHPSLPNYLALLGGDTFGITTDCESCSIAQRNLIDELSDANKTWKAYMEDIPSSCFIGSKYPYAQKHNPFMYFDDIRNNAQRCSKIVPLPQLTADLYAANPPNFLWITPNLCHDMHDCSVGQGDLWLGSFVPSILDSPMFQTQKSLLIITWDESESGFSNLVPAVFVGSNVKKHYISKVPYNHYALLQTIETIWQLPGLTSNDKNSTPMTDFFQNGNSQAAH